MGPERRCHRARELVITRRGAQTWRSRLVRSRSVRREVRGIFHPNGTCPIGAVVDARGAVLGVDGLLVADASIMPTIPRANTNLSTIALAERIADWVRARVS
jgi:choline dehydrogenase-like flavoprotein